MRYFAYGSNLDADQMAARCPSASSLATAYLADHRLAFAGHSKRWGGGVATLVPLVGGRVYGVVYTLSEAGLEALDRFEGVPQHYVREQVEVTTPSGSNLVAMTYVKAEAERRETSPTPEYVETLRRAYERLGFDRAALDAAVAAATSGGR